MGSSVANRQDVVHIGAGCTTQAAIGFLVQYSSPDAWPLTSVCLTAVTARPLAALVDWASAAGHQVGAGGFGADSQQAHRARKGMAGAVSPPGRGTPATVEVGNNALVLGARPRPSALHGSPKS
jgi:hypothetical protein